MSDPYNGVKGSKLSFKGGGIATASKAVTKKKNKKKSASSINKDACGETQPSSTSKEEPDKAEIAADDAGELYTIDAAKRLNYEELFPVECKKFGYQSKSNLKSVEDALDDRVKKKADRYCK